MTKPAVFRMHYNCYTYQQNNVTSCLWSLKRYEHVQQSVSYKGWSWTVVKILFIDQQRCWTSAHFGTNMCFIPQKVTIKIAIENKRLMHNVQDFDCQRREKKKSKLLVRWFLYQSIWVIYNCNSIYGRLLSYMVMLNRLLSIFLHIHSPALLHCCYLFFCSFAFTSCLVCESTGLHLILVLMEMCGAGPGRCYNNNICYIFVSVQFLWKKKWRIMFSIFSSWHYNNVITQQNSSIEWRNYVSFCNMQLHFLHVKCMFVWLVLLDCFLQATCLLRWLY